MAEGTLQMWLRLEPGSWRLSWMSGRRRQSNHRSPEKWKWEAGELVGEMRGKEERVEASGECFLWRFRKGPGAQECGWWPPARLHHTRKRILTTRRSGKETAPLEPADRNAALPAPAAQPVKPKLDFWPKELSDDDSVWFKPLRFRSFVLAAMEKERTPRHPSQRTS